jgi:hypothetical protein
MNGGKLRFREKALLLGLAWNFVAFKINCIYLAEVVHMHFVSMIFIPLILWHLHGNIVVNLLI